ncbi:MAG: type II secretion system secretin GspD [Nitrospirota bacterium]
MKDHYRNYEDLRNRTIHFSSVILFFILLSSLILHPSSFHTGTLYAEAEKKQSKDKKVAVNFVDVDISTVVKFISEVTGKNFVFDDKVKGNVTIIAPSRLSVDDAFSLFTSVLELKGFTVVPSGKVYKIVPISQAKQTSTELSKDDGIPLNDAFITKLIQLKSISSQKAMNFLHPLISAEGHISAFGPGNMLMVVDSAMNIEKVLKILVTIDKPGVEEPELVLLKYANADDVAKILSDALALGVRAQAPSVRGFKPGEAGMAVSVEETKASIFSDSRLNAVILIADTQEREAMKRMIELLDIPLPEATSKINVYFLEHADAAELSKVLENMISGMSQQARAAQPGAQPQRGPFEIGGRITISPDKATNSLVIVASPADYQNLLQVIKQLDRKRKQVYVEAMIVEASIDRLRELGIRWRIMAEKDDEPVAIGGFGTVDASAIQNILSGLAGFTAGGLGNFLDVPVTVVGSDGQATTSILTVPGFAALFSLNEFRGAVNVLSTPQILTSDNKEAEIVVGENVPFISKRERDIVTTNTVLSSIERQDVGITLRITPQITEGDYVKLDIYQEISSVKPDSETILINIGPTTTKRSTKTSVLVQDNQTVVIGGLMEEREEESLNKVPILGDIPVIGWLFKNRSVEKRKTNLFVFLTPHIVREADHLARLTDQKKLDFAKVKERYKSGELLIKFREDIPEEVISGILSAEGAAVISILGANKLYHVKLKKGQGVDDAVEIFRRYREVEYAEPNYIREIQSGK